MSMGDDLLAIIKGERQTALEIRNRPLVDCPICGAVLDHNGRGALNCPMGHFTAPVGATQGSHGSA